MTKAFEAIARWGRQGRPLLLASVAGGAMMAGMSSPAHALLPVIDSASVAQLIHSAELGAQQLAQVEKVVTATQQQLGELKAFYQVFSHITNASQLSSLLLQPSTILALPDLASIENLVQGVGFGGQAAAEAQALLAKLQLYKPSGSDFDANQINTNALATAGQMSQANALYQSQEDRLNGLEQLNTDLGKSGDPKESMDIAARASIENGIATAQGNQAAALAVMQKAQEDASREQAEQTWRQGADDLLQQAQAAEAAAGPGS